MNKTFDQKRQEKLIKLDGLLREYQSILADPLCCNPNYGKLVDCEKKIVETKADIIAINNAEQC